MFATASLSSQSTNSKVVLVYDSDPGSPGSLPADPAKADSVRLCRDLERYRLGSLPQVTMIGPCTPEKPPGVLTGGLGLEDGELVLKSTVGTWRLDVDSCDADNRDLCKASTVPGIPRKGFVLSGKTNQDARVVELDFNSTQKPSSLSVCKEWIAGLTLRHHITTAYLMLFLRSEEKPEEESPSDEREESTTDKSSIFWMWFPSAKPRNLRNWLKFLWKAKLSRKGYEEICSTLNPIHAGFYKVAFKKSDASEPGKTFHQAIFWEEDSVTFIEVKESDNLSGCLEMSTDMKICAPNELHTGFSDWGFGERTQVVETFFLRDRSKLPECYGPVRSDIVAEDVKKRWNIDVGNYGNCDHSMQRRLYQRSCELERSCVKGKPYRCSHTHLSLIGITSTCSHTQTSQRIGSSSSKRRRMN